MNSAIESQMPPPTNAQSLYRIEARDGFAVAIATRETESGCTSCGGTGFVREALTENGRRYERVRVCTCALHNRCAKSFNAAHIPAVHATSTLDNFKCTNIAANKAHAHVQAFLMGWPSSRGFGVAGPVGCGKTHLLAAALRYLALELGIGIGYVDASLLYAQIRRGFSEGKSGGEIIAPLAEVEVLAIDELGKGRGSQFEFETLDDLISRRYNSAKTTLFATNYSLTAPEDRSRGDDKSAMRVTNGLHKRPDARSDDKTPVKKDAPEPGRAPSPVADYTNSRELIDAGRDSRLLYERVGDRVYSRLCAMCDFLSLVAPEAPPNDWRRNPASQRGKR